MGRLSADIMIKTHHDMCVSTLASVPVTLAPVVMVWPPVPPLLVGVGGAPQLLPVHPGAGVVEAALVLELQTDVHKKVHNHREGSY